MTPKELLEELKQSKELYVNADTVAVLFGVSPHTVRVQAEKGLLPFQAVRFSTRWKFNKEDLIRSIERGKENV